jgi:ATP-dependent DNA ligase
LYRNQDCPPVSTVPEGPEWTYEIKLDGYRLEAVKSKGKVTVYSRRRNVLNEKFGYIADVLKDLPDETALDGELILAKILRGEPQQRRKALA